MQKQTAQIYIKNKNVYTKPNRNYKQYSQAIKDHYKNKAKAIKYSKQESTSIKEKLFCSLCYFFFGLPGFILIIINFFSNKPINNFTLTHIFQSFIFGLFVSSGVFITGLCVFLSSNYSFIPESIKITSHLIYNHTSSIIFCTAVFFSSNVLIGKKFILPFISEINYF